MINSLKIKKGEKLENILLNSGYVSKEDLDRCLQLAGTRKVPLEDVLVTDGIITLDILGQAIAESYGVEYADLNTNTPDKERVLKIPEEIAKKYRVVLFDEKPKTVIVSTDDPSVPGLIEVLKKNFEGKKVVVAYSLSADIDASLVNYRQTLDTRFGNIVLKNKKVAPEILEQIFQDAMSFRASDIHFEPQDEDNVRIRFRVDGILHEAGSVTKEYYENILNRIKIQSNLKIDEHLVVQDGALRFVATNGSFVDMRVSIIPTVNGEKVSIRILSAYISSLALSDLGLNADAEEKVGKALKKPFGMILVSGPTGSGKTTSNYSFLRILNKVDTNITTIEDPVEYKIAGANQIQVNNDTGLTFARGLRSIVRQDPNVIFVGEIRDQETAEIAVNAALTGHLLFSTFHANDAASSIPRLLNMGIEPFLLASTLEMLIAQRLVRRICQSCRYSYEEKMSEINNKMDNAEKYFGKNSTVTLYKGKGCQVCGGLGYSGRVALFEAMPITDTIRDLILTNPSSIQISQEAKKEGMMSLFEDGIEKVKSGITSLDELIRVIAP